MTVENLKHRILMYSNEISLLRNQIEDLERGRRVLQLELEQVTAPPLVIVPARTPRVPRLEATCRKCGARTPHRTTSSSGLEVAECAKCQVSEIMELEFARFGNDNDQPVAI